MPDVPAVVPRAYPDATIVILASGPSLTAQQITHVRQAQAAGCCHVIAINSTYFAAPFADVVYASDEKWWKWHAEAIRDFHGYKFSLQITAIHGGAVPLQASGVFGLDADPAYLRSGGHSGHAAINLAVHLGARSIILLGYDGQRSATGAYHHHPPHPDGRVGGFARMIHALGTLVEPLAQRDIAIVNCSPSTAIPHFPLADLETTLSCPPPLRP